MSTCYWNIELKHALHYELLVHVHVECHRERYLFSHPTISVKKIGNWVAGIVDVLPSWSKSVGFDVNERITINLERYLADQHPRPVQKSIQSYKHRWFQ